MKKKMKKGLLSVLMIVLLIGGHTWQAEAWQGGGQMGPFRCSGAGYTYYMRKSGSNTLVGTMKITRASSYIANCFTASIYCNAEVSVGLTQQSGHRWAIYNGPQNLYSGDQIQVFQLANNPSDAYGVGYVKY